MLHEEVVIWVLDGGQWLIFVNVRRAYLSLRTKAKMRVRTVDTSFPALNPKASSGSHGCLFFCSCGPPSKDSCGYCRSGVYCVMRVA